MSLFKQTDKAIELYRQQIREEYYTRYSEEVERKKRGGKFPFEGKWCTIDEIVILQKELKKKDKVVFIELLSLYFSLGIIILALYLLMAEFLLPQ